MCVHTIPEVLASGEPHLVKVPESATKLISGRHTFHCRATGELPIRITWWHNGKQIHRRSDDRLRVRQSGMLLKLVGLRLEDRGQYVCVAQNQHGRVESPPVQLVIQAPAQIVPGQGLRNLTVSVGTQVPLKCTAVGYPTPSISWRKNGVQVIDPVTEKVYSKPVLRVNITEQVTYDCIVKNHHIRGPAKEQQFAYISIIQDKRTSKVRCGVYNGTVCRPYLGGHVVFNNDLRTDLEEILLGLTEELIAAVSPFCRVPAEKALCHYTLPYCDTTSVPPRPLPLCREDCQAVRDLFCHREWSDLLTNKAKGVFLKSRAHLRLPDCARLPSRADSVCSSANLFDISLDVITTSCYRGDGRYYNGKENVTEGGVACQAWADQMPHNHSRHPSIYPILQDSANYCRNPGGEHQRPWCFTSSLRQRWQYCRVRECADTDIVAAKAPSSGRSIIDELLTLESLVIIGVVSVVSLVLVSLIVVLSRRLYLQYQHLHYIATPTDDLDIDIDQLPSNICYHQRKSVAGDVNPRLEKLEFARNDIVFMRDIGCGAFGRVFQAKVPRPSHSKEWTLVVIKMLRENATDEMQQDFEHEVSLMAELNHANVMRLLGVCMLAKPMCLLYEYMSRGDLHGFLRSCSPEHYIVRHRSTDLLTNDRPKLDDFEQLQISRQIAAGMVYLSDKAYVHRDLATRNCLVDADLTVKISDFGLTRSVHTGAFYHGSEHDAIAIRWMPLEAILYNKFSSESDVWSFGVVLWEVFSFALHPYYGLSHEEVMRYITEGRVLSCPDNTSQEIYDLMRLCWSRKPQNRPPFSMLLRSLRSLEEDVARQRKKNERT
ncbi:Muscle, skeletal receptor tyrosine protein kinase [Lamellibrachia satsuma]|nr:Muscle, skeletal receptor tyrosine protein kinase [Lamellibrachia satsuma]